MIDIETLDTTPTAVILSIGAAVFDPETFIISDSFLYKVNGQSCLDLGMTVSFKTIQWWMEQDREAQIVSFSTPDGSISNALWQLSQFIGKSLPEIIWAQGPQFDIIILENAYRMAKKPVPWTYRQIKDCRTVIDLGKIEFTRQRVGHDPVNDAKDQVEMLQMAFQNLGLVSKDTK